MLFTGKGDKGDTYFFGSNDRYLKSSLQAEALGSLDEINSLLGLCKARAKSLESPGRFGGKKKKSTGIPNVLERVQEDLFIIQAELAGSPNKISKKHTALLEDIINRIEKELPPIKTFFLPGGTELGALLDYARTVARRSERAVVRYSQTRSISTEALSYLNRLSSLLYALARIVNYKAGVREKPPKY